MFIYWGNSTKVFLRQCCDVVTLVESIRVELHRVTLEIVDKTTQFRHVYFSKVHWQHHELTCWYCEAIRILFVLFYFTIIFIMPRPGFYIVELNKTEWELPERYKSLSPVGSGAYGQVWWVCHCLDISRIIGTK